MMQRRKGATRAMRIAEERAAEADAANEREEQADAMLEARVYDTEQRAGQLPIPLLAAFDPSLRMSAFAAITLDGELTPVHASACPTTPNVKRGDYFIRRQLDDAKRGRAIHRWAVALLQRHYTAGFWIAAIAIEAPSGIPTSFAKPKKGDPPRPKGWRPPQDAQAFGKMVRGGQAVFDACAATSVLDPVFVSTYGAKEAATGEARPKDGKIEVERGVRRLFGPTVIDELYRSLKGGREGQLGVCDALAVALGALTSTPVLAVIEDYRRALARRG